MTKDDAELALLEAGLSEIGACVNLALLNASDSDPDFPIVTFWIRGQIRAAMKWDDVVTYDDHVVELREWLAVQAA